MTPREDLKRMSLPERIDWLVEEHAKGNRSAFARQMETTRETVSRWLAGQTPNREHAERLAALADAPLDYFWIPPTNELRLDTRSENRLRLLVRDEVERQLLPMKREMAALKGRMTRLADAQRDDAQEDTSHTSRRRLRPAG